MNATRLPLLPLPNRLAQLPETWFCPATPTLWGPPDWLSDQNWVGQSLREIFGKELQLMSEPGESDIRLATSSELPPEGYQLEISRAGVSISASDHSGLVYGIQTLRQLIQVDPEGKMHLPHVSIGDEPRFSYRGLHLDVCRHFFPVEVIKQQLDWMSRWKLNRFHWHLTDDQGWRIEIKRYPKLTELGAWRKETMLGHYREMPHQFDGQRYGGFYTQEEIREVVAYAAERAIIIVPEIEMPGHALSALAAYPELGCVPGPFEVATKWGIFEAVYEPSEMTFRFLENVLLEVMDLFPGQYIHIGGDECMKQQWQRSEFCQQLIQQAGLKDEHELQSYFIRRMGTFLKEHDRSLVGWDEILEGGLAPDAVVMSWRGVAGGIEAAKMGHPVIMTPTTHTYFDYYQGDPASEPLAIDSFLPVEKVYSYEPQDSALSEAEAANVLGVQANVWTEYIRTAEKLNYMIHPRLCALAEVAWTQPAHKDWASFSTRLIAQFPAMKAAGLNVAPHMLSVKGNIFLKDGQAYCELIPPPIPDVIVRYDIDGLLMEDSPRYREPIPLIEDAQIVAQAFVGREVLGLPYRQRFLNHLGVGAQIQLAPASETYFGPDVSQLINGQLPSEDSSYGWTGYRGRGPLHLTLDLGERKRIREVELGFLYRPWLQAFFPEQIELSASNDGETFFPIIRQTFPHPNTEAQLPMIGRYLQEIPDTFTAWLRLTVHVPAGIPDYDLFVGQSAGVLMDEWMVR
ncbi:MAG: family 20 glycosylhydrolase [Bacteroidota bacterium]